jgi:hypothetical protein
MLCLLEVPEVMHWVLIYILETVEGVRYVLELLELMRYVP